MICCVSLTVNAKKKKQPRLWWRTRYWNQLFYNIQINCGAHVNGEWNINHNSTAQASKHFIHCPQLQISIVHWGFLNSVNPNSSTLKWRCCDVTTTTVTTFFFFSWILGDTCFIIASFRLLPSHLFSRPDHTSVTCHKRTFRSKLHTSSHLNTLCSKTLAIKAT